jgi:hypothetical protein
MWVAAKKWAEKKPEKPMSKSRRAFLWASLAGATGASAAFAYYRTHPRSWEVAKVKWGLKKFPPVTVKTKDGRKFTYAEAPVVEELRGVSGDWCAKYARLLAKDHGYQYNRADSAWTFEGNNKHVWKYNETDNPNGYLSHLKPFRLLGVYNPGSRYNGEGVDFTHLVVYLGEVNGHHMVAHNFHGEFRLDDLHWMMKNLLHHNGQDGEVREVFVPNNE